MMHAAISENSPIVNRKYSKSTAFYANTKKDFFASNETFLKEALRLNQFYIEQPKRTHCKLCQEKLEEAIDFTSYGVDYVFCERCGHLNGTHEDTRTFIEKLYVTDYCPDYAKDYIDANYNQRVHDIYIPKVDFILENLPNATQQLLDVGCGSGYFVYACLQRGLKATGIDVSDVMVQFGNSQIQKLGKGTPLVQTAESEFFDHIINTQASIISAVGVIEHLREPHLLFKAFKESKAAYLFYSVPMFSMSVILENAFKGVYPRHLSGAHTHLFTESSIYKMHSLCDVTSIAEWRFGTDIMDLYRSLLVELNANQTSSKLVSYFEKGVGSKVDELQGVLDQNHFCSEIHCLTKKIVV